MAFKPTKQMKIAYDFLIQYNKDSVTFGKNKEHRITYTEYDKPKDKVIRYYHYNTFIGEIVYSIDIDRYYVRLGIGGYSNTDRHNFNSLLACEGLIDNVKCHMHDGNLFLKDINCPNHNYAQVIILGCELDD